MSTTISTTNNCPNGNCDTDGDDTSDIKSPEENNVFQILLWSLGISFLFGGFYFVIQNYNYNFKYFNIITIFGLIFVFSYFIAVIFGYRVKSKGSSCSKGIIWRNSLLYNFIIIIIFAIGLSFAPCFESNKSKYILSFKGKNLELDKWFSSNNMSIAINIFLGYPIILLLIWKSINSSNCI